MKHINLEGDETCDSDQQRCVWYSECGYWTDDVHHVGLSMHVPSCPRCHQPLYVMTYEQWMGTIHQYVAVNGFPYYLDFIRHCKHRCFRTAAVLEIYHMFERMLKSDREDQNVAAQIRDQEAM